MKKIKIISFLIVFFCGWSLWAQSQQAQIVNQGALVYKDADFDAPILAELKAGQSYAISIKKRGPFYKIRIKTGVTGWIADNDVRLSTVASPVGQAGPGKTAKGENTPASKSEKNPRLQLVH